MSQQKEKTKVYAELQELDGEVKELNSHLEKLDEQLAEVNASRLAVEQISNVAEGEELRVPLANGVYIKAKLFDPKHIMINVGADVTVEKEPTEVIEILDSQITELAAYRERILESMKAIISRVEEIQRQIE
ncbi:MAG: prefoldin subunit alpha [Nanoarchaeota archaeon]|nr:prefoldin subunit alpha [Nanoarchaeota archaeon]